MTTQDTLLGRVKSAMPDLHPSEKRIAHVVLSFPGDLASYSASELAKLANVSNATVSRFVRRIGYNSFEEARQAVRAEQKAGVPLFRFGSGGAPLSGAAAVHLEQSHSNLDGTSAALDERAIDDLAKSALNARHIKLFGFRAGQSLARYLAWQMMQVTDAVSVLPRDGETLAEGLIGLSDADCAIVLALRRQPPSLTPLLSALRESGTAVALIGDLPGLTELPARWHFPCITSASGPLLNHVAVMAVCNLIAARTIELSGTEGRKRMSAVEDLHRTLDEL